MTSEQKIKAVIYMRELLTCGEIIERAARGYWMRDLEGEVTFIAKSEIEKIKEGLKRF